MKTKQQPKPNVVKKAPFGGKAAPLFQKKKAVAKAAAKPKAKAKVEVKKAAPKRKTAPKFNAAKYEAARKKVFSLPNTKEY